MVSALENIVSLYVFSHLISTFAFNFSLRCYSYLYDVAINICQALNAGRRSEFAAGVTGAALWLGGSRCAAGHWLLPLATERVIFIIRREGEVAGPRH